MTRRKPHAITRRSFIASAVAASLAGAAPESHALAPLRTGFIGCGAGAMRVFDAMKKARGTFIPVAVSNQSGISTAPMSLPLSRDWRALLDRTDVDVLVIATPDFLHAEMAGAALRAGKHVYLLPPFTRTSEEARQLESLARDCAGVLHVGIDPAEDDRWSNARTTLAQTGAPRWIQASASNDMPCESGWQRDPACSHGPAARALFNMLYPMQCHLTLGSPTRATALGGAFHGATTSTPDALMLTLGFEAGATVVLSSQEPKDTMRGQTTVRGPRKSVELPLRSASTGMADDLDRFADAIAGKRHAAELRLRAARIAQESVSSALEDWAVVNRLKPDGNDQSTGHNQDRLNPLT